MSRPAEEAQPPEGTHPLPLPEDLIALNQKPEVLPSTETRPLRLHLDLMGWPQMLASNMRQRRGIEVEEKT
jgi:hypothetical protein